MKLSTGLAIGAGLLLFVRSRRNPVRYEPGSPEQIALFERAAAIDGFPRSWASSVGLRSILKKESDGWVGIPNYTYGARAKVANRRLWPSVWAELRAGITSTKASATGLGQLLLGNVDKYYPNGRAGIGDPLSEARGMLRYMAKRYGGPDGAWGRYTRTDTEYKGY